MRRPVVADVVAGRSNVGAFVPWKSVGWVRGIPRSRWVSEGVVLWDGLGS